MDDGLLCAGSGIIAASHQKSAERESDVNGFNPAALLAFCFLAIVPVRAVAASAGASDAPSVTAADRDAAHKAVADAIAAHEYGTALELGRAWFTKHPTDLDFAVAMPIVAMDGGYTDKWNEWRKDLAAQWAKLSPTKKRSKFPFMAIDVFNVDGDRIVYVMQCYDTAGEFGVSYKFNVLSAKTKQPLSFFAVESPIKDNQLAKELRKRNCSTRL